MTIDYIRILSLYVENSGNKKEETELGITLSEWMVGQYTEEEIRRIRQITTDELLNILQLAVLLINGRLIHINPDVAKRLKMEENDSQEE